MLKLNAVETAETVEESGEVEGGEVDLSAANGEDGVARVGGGGNVEVAVDGDQNRSSGERLSVGGGDEIGVGEEEVGAERGGTPVGEACG